MGQMQLTRGSAVVEQTAHLVKSFSDTDKNKIIKHAKVSKTVLTAETLVSMKIDIGITWAKLFKMAR